MDPFGLLQAAHCATSWLAVSCRPLRASRLQNEARALPFALHCDNNEWPPYETPLCAIEAVSEKAPQLTHDCQLKEMPWYVNFPL